MLLRGDRMSTSMELKQESQTALSASFPEGTRTFSFQVAGHKHGQGRLELGILKHKNGNLVKPMFEGDRRSDTELLFYETVYQNIEFDPLLEELQSFIPAFHGTWETKAAEKDMKYLCIEDICEHFQNPSVLDLKIGRITYDQHATEFKIQEQTSKFRYGDALGIRITGMKIYDEVNNTHTTQEKMFLRQARVEDFASLLGIYLSRNAQINIWFLCGFLHKLHQIDEWFSKQKRFKFIASSILFVFEGTLSSWSTWAQKNHVPNFSELINSTMQGSNLSEQPSTNHTSSYSKVNKICVICEQFENMCSKVVNHCPLFRVAMIDFAHCYPSKEVDMNYIFGLHSLIDYFKFLLKSQKDILSTKCLSS